MAVNDHKVLASGKRFLTLEHVGEFIDWYPELSTVSQNY
jgi:hypothetical protein